MNLSIFGWMGGSGWGQYPLKKTKPLKFILNHFRSTFFLLKGGGQTRH